STLEGLYLCYAPSKNPYSKIPMISRYWKNVNNREPQFWEAPNGLFWICDNKAYPVLPPRWKGSCTLGVIQPGFFLLPGQKGGELGVPL
ncbi:ENR1 protein, partial [Ptilonorhynchus violaceus]|nr:ENR1 protein [Ptilonorhynchus violaceus]